HLMGVSLVLPLGLHMIAVRRDALWKERIGVVAIVGTLAVLGSPYLRILASQGGPETVTAPSVHGALLPLLGARLLSATQLEYLFGSGPAAGAALTAAAIVSCVAYALVWGGIVLAGRQSVHAWRTREWTPRAHIGVIALGSLACQAIVHGITGK